MVFGYYKPKAERADFCKDVVNPPPKLDEKWVAKKQIISVMYSNWGVGGCDSLSLKMNGTLNQIIARRQLVSSHLMEGVEARQNRRGRLLHESSFALQTQSSH